ncbi:MAG TPA: N-acetylmuramic acid 6-phosphate etherase [Candidatus Acidoferrales bacterium]|nr:N-acetylmuramic acid 6-phosphate etherase [Candidatus Acidoferrales bacterium]
MTGQKILFEQLKTLITEARNPASMDIDSKSTFEILKVINDEDKKVAFAIEQELPYIADAVDIVVHALKEGGRLFYVGAGTSGRIGVQDAAECPPTFGTDPEMIQGMIAGGKPAMFKAQEGAEDHEENGACDIVAHGVAERDVVCGIAASRRTPYVIGAVRKARELGAKTIFVTSNPRSQFNLDADVAICPEVGPEIIMGSTRMKSATAQKMILNMLTTAVMIKLGKVYENMMVDLQMTNNKLEERSKRILMTITGLDYERAERVLKSAAGHVKTAVVMVRANVEAKEARRRLAKSDGFVRLAIGSKFGKDKNH